MKVTAFVGDIHGCLSQLQDLLFKIENLNVDRLVFLGDYVNRGYQSKGVLQFLCDLEVSGSHETIFLAGNHDLAMLECLEVGNADAFLKMGGARTIQSYVSLPVAPDVVQAFRDAVPVAHRNFLSRLKAFYADDEILAAHQVQRHSGIGVWGHSVVGVEPRLDDRAFHLDTGCGFGGPLTALIWPAKLTIQSEFFG